MQILKKRQKVAKRYHSKAIVKVTKRGIVFLSAVFFFY